MIRNMWYVLILCALGAAYANRDYLMSLDWGRLLSLQTLKSELPQLNPDCKLANAKDCLQKPQKVR